MFFFPKMGYFDQFRSKLGVFSQKGQFLAKISNIALDDFSSLGNFTPKNNQKNNFLKFWLFGGAFSECLWHRQVMDI